MIVIFDLDGAVAVAGAACRSPSAGRALELEVFVRTGCAYAAELELNLAQVVAKLGGDAVDVRITHLAASTPAAFGDVASVEAAVSAGCAMAADEGILVASGVIAAPRPELFREFV